MVDFSRDKCSKIPQLISKGTTTDKEEENALSRTVFSGVRVVELDGIGPVPFCGLMLADFGAEVTVVVNNSSKSIGTMIDRRMDRGKKKLTVEDLHSPQGIACVRNLCLKADVLLDPYRPGVLEAMGLNPVELCEANPRLIVARVTGYGQRGPMAKRAGHDINYVAISGLLPMLSPSDTNGRGPWPPANLLADFSAGALMTAFGIASALYRRLKTGEGCILDCSMTDGVRYLGSFISLYKDVDFLWNDKYGLFLGKFPTYRTYGTLDGKWMAVGAIEPKFIQILLNALKLNVELSEVFKDPEFVTNCLENAFKSKTQKEWTQIFSACDACVTPVLSLQDSEKDFEYGEPLKIIKSKL